MRASSEAYKNVAEKCSAFNPVNDETTFQSMYSESTDVSCLKCKHFSNQKYCELDLFDQVAKNHNLV